MLGHSHAVMGFATLAAVQAATVRAQAVGDLAQPLIQAHPVQTIAIGEVPAGWLICGAAAILGALMPDLDAEDSAILRDIGIWGGLVKIGMHIFGVKHRGVLHSGAAILAIVVLAGMVGSWLGYRDVGLAFALGYFSHVAIADAMTISGVPILWPHNFRLHLLPRFMRIRTGGVVEKLVVTVVMVAVVLLLPSWIPPEIVEKIYRLF